MTDAQSANHADILQAVVGVCAFGGVFLFMWAAASGHGPALGLAVALWVVGGILSVGITRDSDPDDEGGSGAADGLRVDREGTVESAGGIVDPGNRTSADALGELRNRYAQGEMTEAEFERRVERLLDADGADAKDEALRTLRNRYARGELSDEQFDHKLDRLTETHTLEDAADAYEREEPTED